QTCALPIWFFRIFYYWYGVFNGMDSLYRSYFGNCVNFSCNGSTTWYDYDDKLYSWFFNSFFSIIFLCRKNEMDQKKQFKVGQNRWIYYDSSRSCFVL